MVQREKKSNKPLLDQDTGETPVYMQGGYLDGWATTSLEL
jgi:hypothetical protein